MRSYSSPFTINPVYNHCPELCVIDSALLSDCTIITQNYYDYYPELDAINHTLSLTGSTKLTNTGVSSRSTSADIKILQSDKSRSDWPRRYRSIATSRDYRYYTN